jgi:septum site-determining protein MinC
LTAWPPRSYLFFVSSSISDPPANRPSSSGASMPGAPMPGAAFRVRGRTLMALILAPEPPLDDWFTMLDQQIERSPAFFAERPVIVNLSALPSDAELFAALLGELELRDLRIVGVEGADAALISAASGAPPGAPPGAESWGRTPLLVLGRSDRTVEIADTQAPPPPPVPAKSLIIAAPVRSGQSVMHEAGDVTVIGSVASGAEIIAGGSIHVYGTLRGRAIAGLHAGAGARIFCRKLEAELMAIDGLYITAEEWGEGLRGHAVQAWRDGDTVQVTALD